MKKIMTVCISVAIFLSLVSQAIAATAEKDKEGKESVAASAQQSTKEIDAKTTDDKTVPAAESAAQQPEITKKEILERLNNIFKYRPNIAGGIKGLETKQDESGNPYYLVNGTKLEDLDQKTLLGILGIVNQQVSIENLQRMQQQERQARSLRQLNQLNQINRIDKNQQAIRQQQNINRMNTPKAYNPPKTYTPPKTYKPPAKY